MNKTVVNNWIEKAVEAIKVTGIADENGVITGNFRGHISSFGAAVTMGSLKSAIAFFAQQGNANIDREKLLKAMYYIIRNPSKEQLANVTGMTIFKSVCESKMPAKAKEDYINASIALKLAMNFYQLPPKGKDKE